MTRGSLHRPADAHVSHTWQGIQREKRTRNNPSSMHRNLHYKRHITLLRSSKRNKDFEAKMEKQEAQHQGKRGQAGEKQPSLEGLPLESSPYLQYKDLEDYKLQGYGAQGHQEPKPGRGAGTTDAPTMPGSAVSSQAEVAPAEAAHRQGTLK